MDGVQPVHTLTWFAAGVAVFAHAAFHFNSPPTTGSSMTRSGGRAT